jgi:hypothetical protein
VQYPKEVEGYLKLLSSNSLLKSIHYPHGVFGGAVRSWIVGRKPRDIDIAVECEPYQLQELVGDRAHTTNRFGGYKLVEGGVTFDLWPLCETWALKNAGVEFTFENLARYASYNIDCIVLTNVMETIDLGFSKAIQDGFVEVNYEPNPIAAYNAIRGLRLCKTYGLKAGKSLKAYFTKYVTEQKLPILLEKYREQYEEEPDDILELLK